MRPLNTLPARLALICVRRHVLVLLLWLLLLAAGLAAAGPVMDGLDRRPWSVAAHESVRGNRLLDGVRPYGGQIDAVVSGPPVAAPAFRRELAAARRDLAAIPGVRAVTPLTEGAFAADRRAALLSVRLGRSLPEPARRRCERAVESRLRALHRALPGVTVTLGGSDRARAAVAQRTLADTRRAEMITLPLTLVVVYLLFGGLVAAAVPLVAAVATVGTAMLWLLLLSRWYDLTSPVLSTTTMVGLGLAVDYSLLTVGRFREELAASHDVERAVVRTMSSAGRSVLFAALVIAAALSGLAAFPSDFYASVGLAAAGTVLLSLAAAVTLTPALLAACGKRIGARGCRETDEGVFAALARWTRRRAPAVALGVGVLLLAAAAPFLRVHLVSPVGELQLPPGTEARRFADLVTERFPQQRPDAVVVVARTDPSRLAAWAERSAPGPETERVEPASAAGHSIAVVRIVPVPDDGPDTADRLVRRLRAERPAGFPVWVTGRAALDADFRAEVLEYAPRAAALIALTSYVLLLAMTRSLLLPLKAIVMNTLSLGASFGALVMVFQDGWCARTLGVHTLGGLGYWLPVVVFALAFGLSMDYEVFLLSRIQELYRRGGDNDLAVEAGVQRSARIISSSALLMCIVFAGFATGEVLVMKQLATALTLVVLVDATLVRCLLVPATMTLLGKANWWCPRLPRRSPAPPEQPRPSRSWAS
ncbi:efflux RND transporter permease subunit [Streptomyces sp. NBC_00091]|uniref:MMPL family transporter n=1 Tax=Streptomyces sp. NBC_00091 TaxID=2975648 RepID=UPI00224D9A3C|nr:efflux RND transporter permease subunit [Streptomyces sp. NBC_00091]MCX5380512.1 efflux RND transporter permease subunit [Streptomyces sp. NBC_00091]